MGDNEIQNPAGALCVPGEPVGGNGAGARPLLSLVVPTYNEKDNIEKLAKQVDEVLKPLVGGKYELIIVDDNSPDGTHQKVRDLATEYPFLKLVHRQGERGLATAVIRGWQVAAGDVLGVMDGDLQHPPSVLAGLWQKINAGADVAVASRHIGSGSSEGLNAFRKMTSSGAQLLGLMIIPSVAGKTTDPMSGCFLLKRSVIAGKVMDPEGYKILVEVLGRGQVGRVEDVPYVFQERMHGETKVSPKVYVDYLAHLIKLRMHLWTKK